MLLFKSTILALLVGAASAKTLRPNNGIPADSKAGHKLMSKARVLDEDEEADFTWMAGYSIKYLGCTSIVQVREEGGEEDESNLYTMNLVKFTLCDSSVSCNKCKGSAAEYVVNMNDFVDAYTETKMNAQEQACEYARESCDCENANDDEYCEYQCYTNLGMDYCIQVDGDEEFNAQEYLECKELEYNNNNNYYNNNQQYYVGPTCSNGFDINLAVFQDAGCTTKTSADIYSKYNSGYSLPFESESMVTNDCISCKEVDQDNDNNGYEISELCENSYQQSTKCEKKMSGVYYPDTSGCDYIEHALPKLAKVSHKGVSASTGLAMLFLFTTIFASLYAFFLYRKIHRAKINLAAHDNAVMA